VNQRGVLQPQRLIPATHDGVSPEQVIEQRSPAPVAELCCARGTQEGDERNRRGIIHRASISYRNCGIENCSPSF
jgi:hypothetical protein